MCSDKLPASFQVLVCHLPTSIDPFGSSKPPFSSGIQWHAPDFAAFFLVVRILGMLKWEAFNDVHGITAAARWMKQLSTSIAGMPGWISMQPPGNQIHVTRLPCVRVLLASRLKPRVFGTIPNQANLDCLILFFYVWQAKPFRRVFSSQFHMISSVGGR